MRGAGHEDVLVVLQVPGNKADAVPCERLESAAAGQVPCAFKTIVPVTAVQ
jgi:hypothetical protein